MADLNNCSFTGRLGVDVPRPTVGSNGKKFVRFLIANNDINKKTSWVSVTAFGKIADYLADYGKKGDLISIVSRFNSYKKEDGTYGYCFNIHEAVLYGKPSAKENRNENQFASPVSNEGLPEPDNYDDDDVPF